MPKTLPLLRGEITYSKARKEEVNILRRLEYPSQRHEFFANLNNHRDWIKDVVTHHAFHRPSHVKWPMLKIGFMEVSTSVYLSLSAIGKSENSRGLESCFDFLFHTD